MKCHLLHWVSAAIFTGSVNFKEWIITIAKYTTVLALERDQEGDNGHWTVVRQYPRRHETCSTT